MSKNQDRFLTRQLKAIGSAGAALGEPPLEGLDTAQFLTAYYADAAVDEVDCEPVIPAAAALSHLAWSRSRKPATAKVRVFNPQQDRDGYVCGRTVVETVTDDMPFLVDSLTMALKTTGHKIHMTMHPVFSVERDGRGRLRDIAQSKLQGRSSRESFIHFEIDREADRGILDGIADTLHSTLNDVRKAVEDWQQMLDMLSAVAKAVGESEHIAPALAVESQSFLEWLRDEHFALLGYQEFEYPKGRSNARPRWRRQKNLGISRNDERPPPAVTRFGQARIESTSDDPVLITKANVRSTVHRPARLDCISVKLLDEKGRPASEHRFLGLFTSVAYNRSPREIPLLRRKVDHVMRHSGLDVNSHRGKALQHILDTLPRDDLLQGSLEDLTATSIGILGLEERHKLSLFCRRDAFGRFYSCLVYMPREQYTAKARKRVERLLEEAFHGQTEDSRLTVSESSLARLEITVTVDPNDTTTVDLVELERCLSEAVRTWDDHVRQMLRSGAEEQAALALFHKFSDRLPTAYKENVAPERAGNDLSQLEAVAETIEPVAVHLRKAPGNAANAFELTTVSRGESLQLHVVMPILENLGLKLVSENNYRVALEDGLAWIQDFGLSTASGISFDPDDVQEAFRECFLRVLSNETDNDGFNRFVLVAGLSWREAALLRAYSRYIKQISQRFSQTYVLEVLSRFPAFCRALIDRFDALFNPGVTSKKRKARKQSSEEAIKAELENTASLDDDRILRSFDAVVSATLRTNYFQPGSTGLKNYFSFKFDPSLIPGLPRPRPRFEIFVYSRRVEGVHLRGGRIARGGLRWSDRREDYRTEVLGLMKAQHVKNALIVPGGAKGGFVCASLPEGDRAALAAEVVHCYQTFVRGLLDVTDNLVAGKPRTPDHVRARDEADPYLVVAADKGTAQFSDVANELSAEYDFWLDDAFASGGSAGYDHKKMGITARGAWVGVQRHFREIGIDVQKEPFTVAGIGDMGGDVFGNGMLLSKEIRLVAAFNHRHIFIDPSPDAGASFAERKRLFNAKRSGWDEYRADVLSKGGGIYSRTSKSIELSAEAASLLGLQASKLTPHELIRAILKARVDLLFNGGIGTYVKASSESQIDAADPGNDVLRVDGRELRCKVVGEGGNLGLTQLGRIEYARRGGRINTDFIDNSGGVDSSDREVNIKILLNDAIADGRLARSKRNALLAGMTDDVAEMVLADNYAQTQALSVLQARAHERIGEHVRIMRVLEGKDQLDRGLEFLPSEEDIEERRAQGEGLTRPELAILLSYSKIDLSAGLRRSDIPQDEYLVSELETYFPPRLRGRFRASIHKHRLRTEIIAMLISSSMINRMGPFFALRAAEDTATSPAQIARAYAIARQLFEIRDLWKDIETLDYEVPADLQYDCMFQVSRMLRRAVYWFLQRQPSHLDILENIRDLGKPVASTLSRLPEALTGRARRQFDLTMQQYERLGLQDSVAKRIALCREMTHVLDIVSISREFHVAPADVAGLYYELGRGLRIDWIRDEIESLSVDGRWRATARANLRETLARHQHALVASVLRNSKGARPDAALASWLTACKLEIARTRSTLDDMRAAGPMDFATLSVALSQIDNLV